MKLYTRLINEGVFIFWNPDEGNTFYNLKIKIIVGDDKIELVNLDLNKGENYYSFKGIGSGDYEIELDEFKDECFYQTETKKIKIVSSAQKEQEQADKILACLSDISDRLSSIDINTCDISSLTRLTDLTDPWEVFELIKKVRGYERQIGY